MPMAYFLPLFVLLPLGASFQLGQHPASVRSRTAARFSPLRAESPIMMAGFGGAASGGKTGGKKGGKKAKAGKSGSLTPKRQWDQFRDLVSGGAERTRVYAQLDGKWTEVGDVAVKSPGTPAQAAQYNKRLILEHAARVKPALQLRARELVAGIAGAGGEPEALAKQEVPEGLVSGFEGLPDASGKYSKVRGTTRTTDPTAIMGSAARG